MCNQMNEVKKAKRKDTNLPLKGMKAQQRNRSLMAAKKASSCIEKINYLHYSKQNELKKK